MQDLQHSLSHAVVSSVLNHQAPSWHILEQVVAMLAIRADLAPQPVLECFAELWADDIHAMTQDQRASCVRVPGAHADVLLLTEAPNYPALPKGATAFNAEKEIEPLDIPIGLKELETMIGSWSSGELVTINGYPGSGKSTLLLNFCRYAAIKHNTPTLIVTSDASMHELQLRMISADTGINLQAARSGDLKEEDQTRLTRRRAELTDAPIWMHTTPTLEADDIQRNATQIHEKFGLRLLALDGVASRVDADWQDGQSAMVTLEFLKDLATRLNITVIATMHRTTPRFRSRRNPIGFPEQPEVERWADIGMVVHRKDVRDYPSSHTGEAHIIVHKNKRGPIGISRVLFQGHYARFVDIIPPAP
ncbi:DnaB-like helicase C-terminal domain-containing protein [Nonomuraea typhae]|uniref:DnaB-like helicase C-terminal domain-containing protein n=1 Tax=Nonomuraea typhae TaxID=2603600 RepID=A0ABW7Z1G1_9ACTN